MTKCGLIEGLMLWPQTCILSYNCECIHVATYGQIYFINRPAKPSCLEEMFRVNRLAVNREIVSQSSNGKRMVPIAEKLQCCNIVS